MMKYFTLDDWIDDQDLTAVGPPAGQAAADEYNRYLDSITDRLPPDFRRLLAEFCIHDGRLRDMRVDVAAGTAVLRFDAGDVTMREGRDISLQYSGVSVIQSIADPKRGLPGPHGYGDLGNDELEILENGDLEHRFLFSSGVQMRIRFASFRLKQHVG